LLASIKERSDSFQEKVSEVYYSRVYTDRPAYADYDSPAKFQAIQSIIAKRLKEHPNAICSYSGGGQIAT